LERLEDLIDQAKEMNERATQNLHP
jgi:hypothetical protein